MLASFGFIYYNHICIIYIFRDSSPSVDGGRAGDCMYKVYCIYNKIANKIYIGQTVDLEKRLEQHNTKVFGGYTSQFTDKWILIYSEDMASRFNALKREKQLKSSRGRDFVKKFIPR